MWRVDKERKWTRWDTRRRGQKNYGATRSEQTRAMRSDKIFRSVLVLFLRSVEHKKRKKHGSNKNKTPKTETGKSFNN